MRPLDKSVYCLSSNLIQIQILSTLIRLRDVHVVSRDVSKSVHNEIHKPYPQLRHNIKMVQRVWVLCTQNLWRELHFEMLTMKNAGFHSGEAYNPPSDVGLRTFKLFDTS